MIVSTRIAKCDEHSCQARIPIPNESTQPFVYLTSYGWSNVPTDNEILTYCPHHPKVRVAP